MLTLWDPVECSGISPSSTMAHGGRAQGSGEFGAPAGTGWCHCSVSPRGRAWRCECQVLQDNCHSARGGEGSVWCVCPHTSALLAPVWVWWCVLLSLSATGPPQGVGMLQLQPPAEPWAAAPATAHQHPASSQVGKAAAWIWRGLLVPVKGFAIPPPPQFSAAPLSSIQGPAELEGQVQNRPPPL